VARVEAVLQPLFNGPVRVRDHWPLARLELEPDELPRALEGQARRRIQEAARAAGYRWATLDLAGYGAGQEGSGK
jgi:uncharacterized protein